MAYNPNYQNYGFLDFGNRGVGDLGPNIDLNGQYSIAPDSSNWFTGMGGLAGLGSLLSGIGQLGSYGLGAYTGLKQLGLAKDQLKLAKEDFGFQKALANRNIANQAQSINNAYDNSARMGAALIGGVNADGTFGDTPVETVKKYEDEAKKQHVDGSAIG